MATYTKLRSGEWGLRIEGLAVPNTNVTVRTKAGATKVERVGRVIWSGNGVTLATIANGNQGSHRTRRNGCGCDCEECSRGCRCDAHCNCRGGNIFDC